ncbi:hypothetical protein H2200_008403 [Cladophialophora chaetospira]|uniref:NADP-dependent oxidoreductase domain-containing protein n=1 Tax=Cladophialophora chaetospira TaxID=386627 RepID=A0AA39CGF8_9EURO|nr:hypothetical protein H2200_008403 [Cladophialophora chaetospira]
MSNTSIQPPKLILGCSNFGSATDPFVKTSTPAQAANLLKTFISHGHYTIDTSRRYPPQAPGTSEEVLGEAFKLLDSIVEGNASISIDTKTLSSPGDHKPANLRASIAASLAALGVTSVNTIYLHFPDRSVPLSDPVSTLSAAVQAGQARQWGLSNYTIDDIREIISLCDQNGWVKPAVYQGEYNALNRQSEPLIRVCHENGIAFYAYSPAAAGVFSPTGSRISASTPAGQRTRAIYGGEEMQAAVQRVRDAAEKKGLGGHEVAIRWAFWNGVLDERDGVIIGASNEKQLNETCSFLKKGGLDDELKELMDGLGEVGKG